MRIVQRRGEAMQEAADATPSGMISTLLLERETVENIRSEASASGILEIANYLCPGTAKSKNVYQSSLPSFMFSAWA